MDRRRERYGGRYQDWEGGYAEDERRGLDPAYRRDRDRGGPERERGPDPTQGYIGFGPGQSFWTTPREDRERGWESRGEREGYYSRQAYSGPQDERGWATRAADEVASWMGDEDAEYRRRMDHRGRGPKGYTRSDDRIREDINDRLTYDPDVDASDIEVAVSGGEATLSGTVDSRWARRRAEDIAESVYGVTHVQNNLRVRERQRSGVF